MKRRVLFLGTFLALIIFFMSPLSLTKVIAMAVSHSGQVMVLDNDAIAYLQKNESAEQKASFKAGDSVFVTSEDDEWFEIFYKGDVLYIKREAISSEAYASNEASYNKMAQAVEEELISKQNSDKVIIESYEKEKAANVSSKIWKGAIVVLVVLIIILSIVIGINNTKMDHKQEEVQEEK